MRAEIIIPDGNLKREVWEFSLYIQFHTSGSIYFDSFYFQVRETARRKWHNESWWERLDKRNNNIEQPSIPSEVEKQARDYFASEIYKIPIQS